MSAFCVKFKFETDAIRYSEPRMISMDPTELLEVALIPLRTSTTCLHQCSDPLLLDLTTNLTHLTRLTRLAQGLVVGNLQKEATR